MAAATMAHQPAPGALTFLKHGVVLPARRPGIFLRLFAMNAVLSLAVHLFGVLVVAPLDAAVNPEDNILTRKGVGAAAAGAVSDAEFSMSKVWLLLGAGAAYLALYLAMWLTKKVAAACAAAAACSSGDRHDVTLGSLLRRVRGSLVGVSATVFLGAVVRAAAAAAAVAASFVALPLAVYLTASLRLLLLGALLAALAIRLCFHLEAVCAMAVVVVAAEQPSVGHGGAVARAWRLMRGTGTRALIYVAATWAMEMVAGPVGDLAVRTLLPGGADRVVVLAVGACLKYVLNFVVDVVSMTSIAAYYFECRKEDDEEEEKAGHID